MVASGTTSNLICESRRQICPNLFSRVLLVEVHGHSNDFRRVVCSSVGQTAAENTYFFRLDPGHCRNLFDRIVEEEGLLWCCQRFDGLALTGTSKAVRRFIPQIESAVLHGYTDGSHQRRRGGRVVGSESLAPAPPSKELRRRAFVVWVLPYLVESLEALSSVAGTRSPVRRISSPSSVILSAPS